MPDEGTTVFDPGAVGVDEGGPEDGTAVLNNRGGVGIGSLSSLLKAARKSGSATIGGPPPLCGG